MTHSENFNPDRDMVFYPAALVTVGMVGPGGTAVVSVTPEEGTRVAIDLDCMTAHLDTARDDHTLGFPVRPIRPEVVNDPSCAWLPADREEFYAEIAAANPWR